ncbi:LssY C-terminal domain-containing protein [Aeromicrobium sp.]|nr:LssY C-terminal domain-containing protein [Candidatus Saccharibacteria bacterium]
MIGFLLRTIWRLIVLTLGIALAYLAFVSFPFLNRQLPVVLILFLFYIAFAYFILPALIRTLRLIIRPDHIPLYATTPDGIPSDPVNIAIVASSRKHFIATMQKAGWHVSDKVTLRNALRELYAIVVDKPYLNAPFSPLLLFNRTFDVGFQIPYGKNMSPRHRHHIRFWQLIDLETTDDDKHYNFWFKHFRRFMKRDETVWIGAAIDDVNTFGIRWYNLQITHNTHPLHYRERDFVIKTLQKCKAVKNVTEVKAGDPFQIHSQQLGNSFYSDGRLSIVELNKPTATLAKG